MSLMSFTYSNYNNSASKLALDYLISVLIHTFDYPSRDSFMDILFLEDSRSPIRSVHRKVQLRIIKYN